MNMFFVSVDGGATKTIAVVYDEAGKIVDVGVNGSSNFRNVGVPTASRNIMSAMDEALKRSGIKWNQADFFTFAVAGVKDSKRSTAIIDDFVSSYGIKGKYTLLNDGEMGFRCRFPKGDGIIVAPGTGMIAYGKQGNRLERCSGWGWFIGDEGGAFYIGRRAIQLSAMIADERDLRNSVLLESIMNFFSVTEPRALVNEIYTEPLDIRRIASIAALVSSLAKNGDQVAISILTEAAKEAARCAISLEKALGENGPIRVSGYGGVYRAGDIYWDHLITEISNSVEGVEFKKPLMGYQAVLGSIHKVLEDHGTEIDEQKLEKLASSLDAKVMNLPKDELSSYLMM